MSYSFPASFASFDPTKAFTGGYGDFSSIGKLSSDGLKSGGGMDPLSLGLGLGSSLISGIFGNQQARAAANIARAQMAAQNQAILEGREQSKAALGSSMWGPMFQAGTGADLSFAREKEAQKWMQGPFAERQLGLRSEQAKRERLGRISPEFKEAAQFENRLAIQREIAARRAQTDAMFGPVRGGYA